MIEDARARRQHKVSEFSCKQCDYKSTSKTFMNKHITTNHNEEETEIEKIDTVISNSNSFNIRKCFSCDNCEYKTTNENVLKMHINTNHKNEVNIRKSKRLHCNMCDKKFNKLDTFNKHMKLDHKLHQTNGRSKTQNVKAVDWGESHTVEHNQLL